MKNTKFAFIAILLISVVLIAGCTSSKTYEQPNNVIANNSNIVQEITNNLVKEFKLGEIASDGKMSIKLNAIDYKDKITKTTTTTLNGEDYTSSFDTNPKDGYKFLILDLTVENLQLDKTESFSSLLQFRVEDSDGYTYDFSSATFFVDKAWKDGDILPGSKRRGSIVYEVPQDVKNLKFKFLFDIFSGSTAVFYL